MARQPWLYSGLADSVFILAPAFVVTLVVWLAPGWFQSGGDVSPWMWLMLVVGVDVAHVYSTLYRTYMDKAETLRYQGLLIGIPLACWIAGILLYSMGKMTFWRVLAYLAVFHFVRQQYGFLRLYARKEEQPRWGRWIDGAAIYGATLFPLLYWHTHPRSFSWFVAGDFWNGLPGWLSTVGAVFYGVALLAYVAKALVTKNGNIPKHLTLAGTALSWYSGIVLHDGDLAFTATNVIAHGVPYMALVWMYERKKGSVSRWFRPAMIPGYVAFLLLLAYVEESLWDVLVWRDHTQFFAWLSAVPKLEDQALLSLIVPLLAVPQATHYVLDGFIWKVRQMPLSGAEPIP